MKQIGFDTFTGLEADTKPTAGIGIDSTFYETDTKLTWFYNGTKWVLLDGLVPPLDQTVDLPPPFHLWNDKANGQEGFIKWRDSVGMDWILEKKPDPSTVAWSSDLTMDGLITLTISGVGILYWGDDTFDRYDGTNVVLRHTYTRFNGTIHFKGTLTKIQNTTNGSNLKHDIALLPAGLTSYRNEGNNTAFGDIASLPSTLTYYRNTGHNITAGDIASLPVALVNYTNMGNNTTSGDIGSLLSTLTYYWNAGKNTTSGDIGSLPSGLTYYYNTGNNTSTGDISSLPSTLTYYYNIGTNTTTGDIASFPSVLTYYYNSGQNTTSGDIGSLPSTLVTYWNEGQNTTSGDVRSLPAGLITYHNQGNNTTSGDIASLSSTLSYYWNEGQNTTTGDIGSLPTGLGTYNNQGNNTTSGNISSLKIALTKYINAGHNTTTGDIASLPAKLQVFRSMGHNTISLYTGSHTWINGVYSFRSEPITGSGLTSNMVDRLLHDLAAIHWYTSNIYPKELWIAGNNQPRTSASDAAVTSLTAQGVVVTAN